MMSNQLMLTLFVCLLSLFNNGLALHKSEKSSKQYFPQAYYPNLNYPFNFPPQMTFFQNQVQSTVNAKKEDATCKNNTLNIFDPETRLAELRKQIKPENLAEFRCDPSDIYCLCKYHPKYKDCVCMAYPKSVVCSSTYCYENKNSYECNPLMCDNSEFKDSPNCFCREHPNHIRCKCKLNPLHKECFCMKFPLSHLCNDRICSFNPNSLYCKCQASPSDPICTPKYCNDNPQTPQCECLVNPLNDRCKCINDPNSCSKENVMKAVVEFDMRIRNMCNGNNNSTNIDNSTIINQYYPPCIYGDGSDKKPKNVPCLPTPPPPQPCDGKTFPCVDKSKKEPCIKTSPDQVLSRSNPAYNMMSQPLKKRCGKERLILLQKKEKLQREPNN